jgi:hypothetical protein
MIALTTNGMSAGFEKSLFQVFLTGSWDFRQPYLPGTDAGTTI